MKKLLFTALAVAALGATQASAMSYHDNEVKIIGFQSISYEILDSCVTDGQDPNGDLNPGNFATVEGNDTFMFHCGRHKSSKVGDWIKSHATYAKSVLTYGEDSFPDQANFATIGTLTVRFNDTCYVFDDVLFAQYSSLSSNLWIISKKEDVRDIGWTGSSKSAVFYGYSCGGFQGHTYIPSRLFFPLCSFNGTTHTFSDVTADLKERGYFVREDVL